MVERKGAATGYESKEVDHGVEEDQLDGGVAVAVGGQWCWCWWWW